MSSDDNKDIKIDGFEDIQDIVGDDEEQGFFISGGSEETEESEENEDSGIGESSSEDPEYDELEPDEPREPGDPDGPGDLDDDIPDDEEPGGNNKKNLIIIGGMGVVLASVVGFVGYDALKGFGVLSDSAPVSKPANSTPSMDGAWGEPANIGEDPATTSQDNADFDELLGEVEDNPSTSEDVLSEPGQPKSSAPDPTPKKELTLGFGKVAKKESEQAASAQDTDLVPAEKVDTSTSVSEQAVTPVIPDPYEESQSDRNFDAQDFSYMRMEEMLKSYADEAGYIDDRKLKAELGVVKSELSQRMESIESEIATIQDSISDQAKKDTEHDEQIAELQSRVKAIESAGSVAPKVDLPPLTDRTRLKGFKVISASDDGKMVTAKTPSGKIQVFFKGEVLFVRGPKAGSYTVQKIEGNGQRVLVGNDFYFDDVHVPAPKPKPKPKASKADSEDANPAKEASRHSKSKSSPSDNSRSAPKERTHAQQATNTRKEAKGYIIAEKNPAKIAQEIRSRGFSVSPNATQAKGWIYSGGETNRTSFLIKSPQGDWHVVKAGDKIHELGVVKGVTESGNLAVGDYIILAK